MAQMKEQHHMLAGMIAGLGATTLLHPMDIIKTRYQVFDGKGAAYSSIFNAIRTIWKNEGAGGFWLGLLPASLAATVSWGGYFYFYESFKSYRLKQLNYKYGDSKLTSVDHLMCGVEAGSCMVLITNPLWLIKTRLQLQHKDISGSISGSETNSKVVPKLRNYSGFLDTVVLYANAVDIRLEGLPNDAVIVFTPKDAFRSIIRDEGGLLSLYRGIVPALFLTSHGAIQFMAYEKMKQYMGDLQNVSKSGTDGLPVHVTMSLGVLSKLVATSATYPYQVIKSRLQQRDLLVRECSSISDRYVVKHIPHKVPGYVLQSKYAGTVDCIKQLIRNEGFYGFYRGFAANCIKVAPSSAITLTIYEQVLNFFKS